MAQAHLFVNEGHDLLAAPVLQEEFFGATSLIVRCADMQQLRMIISALERQLTIALHLDAGDQNDARSSLPLLERKAGRILTYGFGTGVEVAHVMVHGGPHTATSAEALR